MGRTPVKRKLKVKTKADQRDYECRLIEDGKSCKHPVHCRGLCSRHHTYLLRWDLVEKYGAKKKFVYVEQAKYKVNKKATKHCRVIENGKQCRRGIHGRGLCARHWLTFERHGLLKKYGTSSRKDPRKFGLKRGEASKAAKFLGQCRMVENGEGCTRVKTSRGLCSKHYLRFLRGGEIEKYGIKE